METKVIDKKSREVVIELDDTSRTVQQWSHKPDGPHLRVTHVDCRWRISSADWMNGRWVTLVGPRILKSGQDGKPIERYMSRNDELPDWVREVVEPLTPDWFTQ